MFPRAIETEAARAITIRRSGGIDDGGKSASGYDRATWDARRSRGADRAGAFEPSDLVASDDELFRVELKLLAPSGSPWVAVLGSRRDDISARGNP